VKKMTTPHFFHISYCHAVETYTADIACGRGFPNIKVTSILEVAT